ncbi:MAG: hypothetical protein GC179_17765 [Anaerolineaceae bacterium]|nr:hypothetical protein [Anaerolineaceae bacterium]
MLELSHWIKLTRLEAVIIVLITAAGFGLALTGYQHGLPFIDYPDEMTMWTRGRATIDSSWDMFQPEYPPGMVWLSALVQQVEIAQGDPYINPAGATQIGRFTSVMAFTVTLLLIMLLTRALLTGVVIPAVKLAAVVTAGLTWMLLPLAVLHARYAMPDCWLCMWFVASVLAAVQAWKRQSEGWLWLSLALGILATLFKWQAAVIFVATGIACLRFWPRRQQFIRIIIVYGVIVGAFSIWVVFVRHALEGGLYMPGTKPGFPTPFTVLDNLAYQATDIGSWVLFGLLPLIGLILLAVKRLRQAVYLVPVLMLPAVILALDLILSINGSRLFPRHYLPALALLAVLSGIGAALSLHAIGNILVKKSLQISLVGLVVVGLVLPVLGMAGDTLKLTQEQLRPDRRVSLMDWIGANALDYPLMVTDVNLAAAVDPLYGYRGQKVTTPEWGAYIHANEVTDEKLAAQHIHYLIASPSTLFTQLKTLLTPIITHGDDLSWRGETWTVYRVGEVSGLKPPNEYITFGDTIQLRGFAVDESEVCAGQTVTIHTAWGAVKPPQRYYAYFMHLANLDQGELSTPINGQQPVGDNRPTITWTRPEELLIAPEVSVPVAADIMPGRYELWLGLFEPEGTERLYLPDGKHYAVVGSIAVQDCAN